MAKPHIHELALVTATVDPIRAETCFGSWTKTAIYHWPVYVVWSYLVPREEPANRQAIRSLVQHLTPDLHLIPREGGGVVPAFNLGVQAAFRDGAHAVLCLHDDVLIDEEGWDARLLHLQQRGARFAGFGGGTTLGAEDIYRTPYAPQQLTRGGFMSNMRSAEVHGVRTTLEQDAVVFDGFSQYGTEDWFPQAWAWLAASGIQHHAYDAALGCFARRAACMGHLLPIACEHLGGQTAVGSQEYNRWALTQHPQGDQGFWEAAHQIVYEEFRDVLPIRIHPALGARPR